MKIISTVAELQKHIRKYNTAPRGLVPTMGSLHKGHLSLVSTALLQCPIITVSIYVNPKQFNNTNDLKHYPRSLDNDLNLLKKLLRHNDIVFAPDDKEIYPEEDNRVFNFGNIDKIMEAQHRSGHFNGVAQVVDRLFNIVNPDIAYFGIKDLQQLTIIKELVKQTSRNIKIEEMPIVRENDGLAMSSRNKLLDPLIRRRASIIFKTLSSAANMINKYDVNEIKTFVENSINSIEGFTIDYFEIVDKEKLNSVSRKDEMKKDKIYYGCIAVHVGEIRLIDNMEFVLT